MNPKIQEHHRRKPAYIYLRQSTPGQVRHHQESTERQYALREKALELGWRESLIRTLDRDLGKSWTEMTRREGFKTWLVQAAPPGVRLVLIFDRGDVRVALIKDLNLVGQPYVIRGRKDVIVQAVVRGRPQRISLGCLPHRSGQAVRYRHVLYHSRQAEPVDVIVCRERGFQHAWFLIVPPDSESWLPADEVVRLYRQRMQIEHWFRDWKSHLGLRGLHLQVDKSRRLLGLLMAFTLAYLLVLLLGQDPLAEKVRPYLEAPRRRPRHGTAKFSVPCRLPFTCSPINAGRPAPPRRNSVPHHERLRRLSLDRLLALKTGGGLEENSLDISIRTCHLYASQLSLVVKPRERA